MTAWDYLVAKSALTVGTAYDHLMSIKEALGNVFLNASVVTTQQLDTSVAQSAPTIAGADANMQSGTPAHPFYATPTQFCATQDTSVFVLTLSKSSS